MLPFFDYRPVYRAHREAFDAAIRRVLESGRLILDREVRSFEEEFAAWIGAAHAVGVNSGTDALALALRALEVGAGDEVITVANAGVPPVAAIRQIGAVPRLVDVDPESLTLAPERLAEAIGPRTRAIVPVHLYGLPAALGPLLEIAASHQLPVVEDAAQGHGARLEGRHVGTLGAIGCFSFYPTKNLGAFGDGGLCTTSDAALAERLRSLRMYGFDGERDRDSRIEGVNSRLDELQAALLRVRLTFLADEVAERRALAARYRERLAGSDWKLPATPAGRDSAYHLFVVRGGGRDEGRRRLDRAGIGHGIHYPVAVHRMRAYGFLGLDRGALPVTERACETVLSLPLYPGMTETDVDRVVDALAASG